MWLYSKGLGLNRGVSGVLDGVDIVIDGEAGPAGGRVAL